MSQGLETQRDGSGLSAPDQCELNRRIGKEKSVQAGITAFLHDSAKYFSYCTDISFDFYHAKLSTLILIFCSSFYDLKIIKKFNIL